MVFSWPDSNPIILLRGAKILMCKSLFAKQNYNFFDRPHPISTVCCIARANDRQWTSIATQLGRTTVGPPLCSPAHPPPGPLRTPRLADLLRSAGYLLRVMIAVAKVAAQHACVHAAALPHDPIQPALRQSLIRQRRHGVDSRWNLSVGHQH